jgi:MFS family permease
MSGVESAQATTVSDGKPSEDIEMKEFPSSSESQEESTMEVKEDAGTGKSEDDGEFEPSHKFSLSGDGIILVELAFIVMLIMFIEVMLVPALPIIKRQDGFREDASWISWVLSVYMLTGAVSTPMMGRLGDLYGKKRMMTITMSVYLFGCIGCGFSQNMAMLIGFRAVQGVGMSTFPLAIGIIRDTFAPQHIPMAIGLVSAMFSIGVSVGLLGGGAMLKVVEWNEIFFIMSPFIFIMILIVHFTVKGGNYRAPKLAPLDFVGAGLLAVAVLCILVPITQASEWGWGSPEVVISLLMGVATFTFFFAWEKNQVDPLVNIEIILRRDMFGTNATALFVGCAMFIIFQSLPFFISSPKEQGGLGEEDTFQIGLIMFWSAIAQLFMSPISSILVKNPKIGAPTVLSVGLIVLTIAYSLFIPFHGDRYQIAIVNSLTGVGLAPTMVSMINVVAYMSLRHEFGISAGMDALWRIMGGALGPGIAQAIMDGNKVDHTTPDGTTVEVTSEDGYVYVWIAVTIFAAIAFVLSFIIRRRGYLLPVEERLGLTKGQCVPEKKCGGESNQDDNDDDQTHDGSEVDACDVDFKEEEEGDARASSDSVEQSLKNKPSVESEMKESLEDEEKE